MPIPRKTLLAVALMALGAACTDRSPTLSGSLPPEGGRDRMLGSLQCHADVVAHTFTCVQPRPAGVNAPAALYGQNQVKLTSSNIVSDTVNETFTFDVTVQNLLAVTMGTPDGVQKTGLKVFYETGPAATAYKAPGDTGTVTVANASGYQNFTGPAQPYHLYDTILAPQQVSAAQSWQLSVPSTVQTFAFTVRVFTATPLENRVTLGAPDFEPAWFSDPARSMRCYGNSQATCLRGVVSVAFAPGTVQEERQSAVDMVKGTVVGGGLGFYYVETPDTTLAQLEAALRALDRLPQVQHAIKYNTTVVPVDYLTAHDAASWRQWRLHPDSADGQNWAAERLGGPFAWGCSVGDSTTAVAVVDQGFHDQPDLARNRDAAYGTGWNAYASQPHNDHGTRVAAVVAARGNDTSQVTGMMWRASLRLYDASMNGSAATNTITYPRMWRQMRDAGMDGARVINLSLGYIWRDSLNQVRDPGAETDTAQQRRDRELREEWYTGFVSAMDSVVAAGHDPLIVFSAGNQGIDAEWNVARVAAERAPHQDRVLVVGASTPGNAFATFSNHGRLVEVAAPGDQVYVLHGDGVVDTTRVVGGVLRHTGTGTSFAAPQVTGIAGLLFAFDPRLSADSVKQLILQGAQAGNRFAGTYRLANAHESLRAAARRNGAPLCGQRAWIQDSTFTVQRDSGTDRRETLFNVGATQWGYDFNIFHGGKQINFYDGGGGGNVSFYWDSAQGWHRGASDGRDYPQPGSNATTLSRDLTSHNADTTVIWDSRYVGNSIFLDFELMENVNYTTGGVFASVEGTEYSTGQQCVQEFVSVHPSDEATLRADTASERRLDDWLEMMQANPCFAYTGPATVQAVRERVAYSPRGDAVYVFMNKTSGGTTLNGWSTCGKEGWFYGPQGGAGGAFYARVNARCRGWSASASSNGSDVYRISTTTGTVTPLTWSSVGIGELRYPSIRENVRELSVERMVESASETGTWTGSGYQWQTQTTGSSSRTCTLQFRNLVTGAVEFSPPVQCREDKGDAGIAPSKTPTR
jgi:hypothetical protein